MTLKQVHAAFRHLRLAVLAARRPSGDYATPPLHRQMGMRVRTRMVRYRGINSSQCVLLPVSEACGWEPRDRKWWPTKRDRVRQQGEAE